MNAPTSALTDFLCPGETHPISRALHLARLAEFYPACRNCTYREDRGVLSAKLVQRLNEAWSHGQEAAAFHEEGFGGKSPNDLSPRVARQVAGALGIWLQRSSEKRIAPEHLGPLPKGEGTCRVAVAGDARPIASELVAAACEGLRWSACETFDLGPATSAGVQFAVEHFQLDGAILVGNAGQKSQTVCMKFWGPGPRRLRGIEDFQPLETILQKSLDRPARSFGPQHRLQAEPPYLASLAERFHGLRPLRMVVDSTSRPWVRYLDKLLQVTACRIVPCRVLPHQFAGQIVSDNAHFGVRVSNDGECCTIFDEQGRHVEEADLSDIGRENLDIGHQHAQNERAFDTPRDALATVGRILQALSCDDRPFSAVLDRRAAEQ